MASVILNTKFLFDFRDDKIDKLYKITHFVEPCVHVADSWSRIASAFDHHVDVERLLDDEKTQVLAAKMNKIKYRNRFEVCKPTFW